MAELISGPTMVLQWIWSGGTESLAADYRACSWAPSTEYTDITAGSDGQHGRVLALKDAKASITLVGQTGGTKLAAALQPGVSGTLIIGPEGTATGKRKITFPSYCDGAVTDFPYNEVMAISCGFTAAGNALTAWTDSAY